MQIEIWYGNFLCNMKNLIFKFVYQPLVDSQLIILIIENFAINSLKFPMVPTTIS